MRLLKANLPYAAVMMMLLPTIFGLASCLPQTASPLPPAVVLMLDDPPLLQSFVPMKNAKGEPGFWMNREDAEKEAVFREKVKIIRGRVR